MVAEELNIGWFRTPEKGGGGGRNDSQLKQDHSKKGERVGYGIGSVHAG